MSAVTSVLALVFSALHLEDNNLLTLYEWVNYFTYYFCTLYYRGTNLYVSIVVYEENLVKLYCLTLFSVRHVMNEQFLALLNLELLTVNLYDCVHYFYKCVKRVFPGGGLHSQALVWPHRTLNRLQRYHFFLICNALPFFFC